jgi:hypothetical protein
MFAFVPLIGTLIVVAILREIRSSGGLVAFLRTRPAFLAGATLLVITPLSAEVAWVAYCDHIKGMSPFTAWLTAEELGGWTFGSLEQRLDPVNWKIIGYRLAFALPPYLLTVLIVLGFLSLRLHNPRERALYITSIVGFVAPIAVFFNLYLVHDYYLMAVTAPLAILVGFGGNYLLFHVLGRVPVAVLVLAAFASDVATREIFIPPKALTVYEYRLAVHLRAITEPEERVVVLEKDWNPFILYHARRRGFMLRDSGYGSSSVDRNEIVRFLKQHEFTVIVTPNRYHWLVREWENLASVPSTRGFYIFRVESALPAG